MKVGKKEAEVFGSVFFMDVLLEGLKQGSRTQQICALEKLLCEDKVNWLSMLFSEKKMEREREREREREI